MIINKSDKILIAQEAVRSLHLGECQGICSALVRGAKLYNFLAFSPPEIVYKEFLEEHFSPIKQIAVEVTISGHYSSLRVEPEFFIDRFWWDWIDTSVRIDVLEEYIKRMKNGEQE